MKKTDTKRRQPFIVEGTAHQLLATGILYEEGNVQLEWRASIGWTAEQFHSIEKVFHCEPDVQCIRFVSTLAKPSTDTVPATPESLTTCIEELEEKIGFIERERDEAQYALTKTTLQLEGARTRCSEYYEELMDLRNRVSPAASTVTSRERHIPPAPTLAGEAPSVAVLHKYVKIHGIDRACYRFNVSQSWIETQLGIDTEASE